MKIRLALLLFILCQSAYSQWMPMVNEFKLQNTNDSLRLKFLVTDVHGVVWFGSNQGLLKHTSKTISKPIHFPQIITCATSIDSTLWVGSDYGSAYCVNPVSHEIESTIAIADSSAISYIYGSGNRIAFATFGEGVFLREGNKITHYSKANLLSDNHVYQVILKDNLLICATDRGIDVVDVISGIRLQSFSTSITPAIITIDSMIIASSYRYGLMDLNLTDPGRALEKKPLNQLAFTKLKKYGSILFGLTQNGVFEISMADSLHLKPIIQRRDIIDFVVLEEGVLMALSESGIGLIADLRISKSIQETSTTNTALTQNSTHVFTGGNGNVQIWNSNSGDQIGNIILEDQPVIVSMAATAEHLFIGTFNHGLYKYSIVKKTLSQIDITKGLPDNNVLSMSLRNDTLWFTTLSGVSSLLPSGEVNHYGTPKDATYIYSIFTNDTAVFIGTDGDGLYEFENENFLKIPFADYLSDETVYNISEDGNNNLWFITKNKNLVEFSPKTNKFTVIDSYSDGYIMASGGYKNSALVIGNGRLKYFHNNRSVPLENSLVLENLSGEYINNISFDGIENSVFASGKSLYRFNPQRFDSYPHVVLESFSANLNEKELTTSELDYDVNHIVYTFEPVWYQNPENVKFRYRLTGIDTDWNYSSGNTAVYPNLKYGTYTFEIETGLENMYYPESSVKHRFEIAKPFYIEWWFIALVFLFFILFIYLIVQWQSLRINRRWLSEKKLIESELAVLRNQVNPHFLFNSLNTLLNLIETNPTMAEEYLQRLSHFYRKILENQEDQVVSLGSEMENLEEYIYLQQQRFGKALVLENKLDPKILGTRIPALTLQLLAENAIKHNIVSQSNPLIIRIHNTNSEIVIHNHKSPLTQAPIGTGTGLENIHSRYKVLFKKTIEIVDDPNEFSIILPIIG